MTIRTAIIGLGIMGRRMAEHMARHPEFTITAMWDPDAEGCALAKDMVQDAPLVDSAEAAIATADLVYLACPPVPRRTYTEQAVKAGKALFLEKPLGVDVAESRAMVDVIAASGVPAAVNFTQAAGAALSNVSQAAKDGTLGTLKGADIVVTYAAWPRAWQKAADWLRLRAEGGMTREVISHFLFFSERILGPLDLVWAKPEYPADPKLCETHVVARLITSNGMPVSLFGSVGGAQPDRQELTIKGETASRRISEFYLESHSDGGPFETITPHIADPRAVSLKSQLDDLAPMMAGKPHRLATLEEALRVQMLVEAILAGGNNA